jgi:ligand-binding sensor domain-containing protein/signal transduction histidine kinase
MNQVVRFFAVCLSLAVSLIALGRADGPHRTAPSRVIDVVDGADIRFTQIGNGDGISQTRVGQIVQDNQGFMWFGTQYGLNRYDGYSFRVFLHSPDDPKSLGGVYIYSLFKDRSGAIWIGCDQSFDRFDPETETFTHFRIGSGDLHEVLSPVTQISQDAKGLLWLATGKGLYQFNPVTGETVRYRHDPKDPASLSSSDVKAALEDRQGDFWVATSEGIDKFDRVTGKITSHLAQHEQREVYLHEDAYGIFWVTHVSGGGLAILDRKTNTLTPISLQMGKAPIKELIGMSVMLEDRNGVLWAGTAGAGLFKFDRAAQRFVRYRNSPSNPHSLPENSVDSLFEDREGNIWVGIGGTSPCLFPEKRLQFTALPNTESIPNPTLIDSLFADDEGTVWIGSRGILHRVRRDTNQSVPLPSTELSKMIDVIAIVQDHVGNIWFGTLHDGLTRFNRKSGRIKVFHHQATDPSSLSSDTVAGLLVDKAGVLWASTWNGFDRFDAATERFTTYKPEQGAVPPLYLSMGQDQTGAIWIGTHFSNLHRFDPATARFTIFEHNPQDPRSLSNGRVNSVFVDHAGAIWVATQNGLDRLDTKTNQFTTYYERDGLGGNAVSCILEDEKGKLWMGTNKGISSFDRDSKLFKNYFYSDGLPGNDMTGWASCTKSSDGEMFFGGWNGGVAFRPDQLHDTQWSGPVILTDLRLSGREVKIGRDSPLKKSITQSEDLILTHNQNILSLEFSALSYLNPTSTRYRYRLDKLDRDWNQVGSNQRVVTYTGLPAGSYDFRVQANSGRGTWSESGATLRITILPAWWATWWFRVAYITLAGLLVTLFYWYRLRQVEQRYSIRLEERIVERARIARELHDTLLQGFHGLMLRFQMATELIPKQQKSRQVMEDALDRADRLLAEGRERIQDLRHETDTVRSLPELLASVGEEMQKDSVIGFKLIVLGSPRELNPLIQEEMYLIAREALVNSFTHSRGSLVEAEILYEDSAIQLRVRDDGQGIPAGIVESGKYQGHWGLPGMRERTEKIGGQFKVWNRSGAGAEVEVRVPQAVAYLKPAKLTIRSRLRALFHLQHES